MHFESFFLVFSLYIVYLYCYSIVLYKDEKIIML